MQRFSLIALSLFIILSFGCSNGPEGSQTTAPKNGSPHSKGPGLQESPPRQPFVVLVAKQKLPEFSSKTLGAMFDDYRFFSSRDWNETKTATGKVYVDFKGLFVTDALNLELVKKDIARQGVEIKFVVEPDGKFYVGMVSRIEVKTDGKMFMYPLKDGKKIVEQIYGNKEIVF